MPVVSKAMNCGKIADARWKGSSKPKPRMADKLIETYAHWHPFSHPMRGVGQVFP